MLARAALRSTGATGYAPAVMSRSYLRQSAPLPSRSTPTSSAIRMHSIRSLSTTPAAAATASIDTSASAVSEIAMKIGDLKAMGLGTGMSGWAQQALEAIHVTTGMPWWATLVTGALALRVALLPLAIKSARQSSILHNIQPKMRPLQAQVDAAKARNDSRAETIASVKIQQLMAENNVGVIGNLISVIAQFGITILGFVAVRKMALFPVPQLASGGLLWFTDLSAADPTHVLPLATAASMTAIMHRSAKMQPNTGNGASALLSNPYVYAGLGGVSGIFMWNMPAASLLYIMASGVFTSGQMQLLQHKDVAKYFNIPEKIKLEKKFGEVDKTDAFTQRIKKAFTSVRGDVSVVVILAFFGGSFAGLGIPYLYKTYFATSEDE